MYFKNTGVCLFRGGNVPPAGIEPATFCLQDRRSTTELWRLGGGEKGYVVHMLSQR
jgi:hypothetical protein